MEQVKGEEGKIIELTEQIKGLEDILMELMEQLKSLKDASGNTVNKRKLRRDDIEDDELIRLYVNDNLSVYSIAKLTGYNYMTIRSRLIRAGVYIEGGHNNKV